MWLEHLTPIGLYVISVYLHFSSLLRSPVKTCSSFSFQRARLVCVTSTLAFADAENEDEEFLLRHVWSERSDVLTRSDWKNSGEVFRERRSSRGGGGGVGGERQFQRSKLL